MKLLKSIVVVIIIALAILFTTSAIAEDGVLNLPAALQIIEEEAFYGSTSLDMVVLPEGVKEIRARAFAGSSVSVINLPGTLEQIADDAFPAPGTVKVTAEEGTWAYEWALEKGYIEGRATSPLDDFVIENGIVVKYVGPGGDVVIPSKDGNGDAITQIGESSFIQCKTVTGIHIPYGVTIIGSDAFNGCENLTWVDIPVSVTEIESAAFLECVKLEVVSLPDGLVSINGSVFSGCGSLTGINIPDGVTAIGPWAFQNCKSLTEILLPSAVNEIGMYAFAGCKGLSQIDLPAGLKSIGSRAFFRCTGLTEIAVPKAITSLDSSFEGCSALQTVSLPDGLEGMYMTFKGCTSLTHIDLPDSLVTMIYTFENCSSLTSIRVPDKVTKIGDQCFSKCLSLVDVTLPESLETIGYDAFYKCAFTQIQLSGNVTQIHSDAFRESSLEKVIAPEDSYAWQWAEEKGYIVQPVGGGDEPEPEASPLEDFVIEDGIVTKYIGPGGDVVIPSKDAEGNPVTAVGKDYCAISDSPFRNCTSLTSVTIPASVTSIGDYAFSNCISLTSVTMQEGVTSIGSGAFHTCSRLKSMTIPDGVISIGSNAFYDCNSLTSITIPASVTSIGDWAFVGCSWMESIYTPSIEAWLSISFSNYCSNPCGTGAKLYINRIEATQIVIPNSVTNIGNDAFYRYSGLTSVTIPASVTSIGYGAFEGCSSLTSVTIQEGVTSIGLSMFEDCTSLTSVTIPASVTSIDRRAFKGCSGLTSVTIKEGVTNIGSAMFCGCTSLASVTIPASVTSIESAAFEGCTSLTSVTIQEGVTSIDSAAFYGCSSLTSVTIPASVYSIGKDAFKDCSNLTAYVESGSFAEQYCIDNNIPYRIISNRELTVSISAEWGYIFDDEPIIAFASASGGVMPYEFRFRFYQNEDRILRTNWMSASGQSIGVRHVIDERDADWRAAVEVRDALGNTAMSKTVSVEAYVDYHDEMELRGAMFDLVLAAPKTESLTGYIFNSDMQEVAWLSTVVDLLHADLSILKTQEAHEEYLFQQAFRAAAQGSNMTLLDAQSMPQEVTLIAKTDDVTADSYIAALHALIEEGGSQLTGIDSTIFDWNVQQYFDGKLSLDDLRGTLNGYDVPDGAMDNAIKNCELIDTMKSINTITKGVQSTVSFANGCIDVYNQLELLRAMNRGAARKIANIYLSMNDAAYKAAGERLLLIANTSSFEGQVALIVGGQLAEMGLDKLLSSFKLTKGHPVISFAYTAADYISGAGSYAKTINELQWACDALYYTKIEFEYAVTDYRRRGSDEDFYNLIYCYTNYLQLAASVEEAYVDVVKWEQKTPIAGTTPDYVLQQKAVSEQKASALRKLSDSVRQVISLYDSGDFASAATWLRLCVNEQEELKDIGVYHYTGD